MKIIRFPETLIANESARIEQIFKNAVDGKEKRLRSKGFRNVLTNKIITGLEFEKGPTMEVLQQVLSLKRTPEEFHREFLAEYKRVLDHDLKQFHRHYRDHHATTAMKSTFAKVLKPLHKK